MEDCLDTFMELNTDQSDMKTHTEFSSPRLIFAEQIIEREGYHHLLNMGKNQCLENCVDKIVKWTL